MNTITEDGHERIERLMNMLPEFPAYGAYAMIFKGAYAGSLIIRWKDREVTVAVNRPGCLPAFGAATMALGDAVREALQAHVSEYPNGDFSTTVKVVLASFEASDNLNWLWLPRLANAGVSMHQIG